MSKVSRDDLFAALEDLLGRCTGGATDAANRYHGEQDVTWCNWCSYTEIVGEDWHADGCPVPALEDAYDRMDAWLYREAA